MSRDAHYFKVGLFLTVALVVLAAGVVLLGSNLLFQDKLIAETYINESVKGLEVGSPITYRGVAIGRVEEINLARVLYAGRMNEEEQERYGRYVVVRVGITAKDLIGRAGSQTIDLDKAITGGLRVRTASQGITGVLYLEVDYLDPAENPPLDFPWQPECLHVPSAASQRTRIVESVEETFDRLGETNIKGTVDHADALVLALKSAVEDANVPALTADLRATLADFKAVSSRVREILGDPALDSVAGDVAALAGDGRETVRGLRELVERTGPTVEESVAGIPATLAQVRQTLGRVDRLLAGPERDIDAILLELRGVMANLSELTDNARRYPSQVLFGNPPPPIQFEEK